MSKLKVPNIKKMFICDPEMRTYEIDLKGADARVVAWEADDIALKSAFRAGLDIHCYNAFDIWPGAPKDLGLQPPFDCMMFKTEKKLKPLRHKAKTGVHAVDYGCKARTLAEHLNITEREAEAFIRRWFFKHPAIEAWQKRVEAQLYRYKYITNVWGYRRDYFDRVDSVLPKALAWIGQSTTAIAINKLIVQLDDYFKDWIQITNQTHDSVTFQCRDDEVSLEEIKGACHLTIPYEDPMEMPVEISSSLVSWGDCEEVS